MATTPKKKATPKDPFKFKIGKRVFTPANPDKLYPICHRSISQGKRQYQVNINGVSSRSYFEDEIKTPKPKPKKETVPKKEETAK